MEDFEHDLRLVEEFDALEIHRGPRVEEPGPDPEPEPEPKPEKPKEKYPAKQHALKVVKQLGVDNGLIYLPGALWKPYEDSDMVPSFRQRRYFYYMAGVDVENCAVTYNIGTGVLILWIPPVGDPRQVLYLGRTPSAAECLAVTDVDFVHELPKLPTYLHAHAHMARTTLFVLHPSQAPECLRISPDATSSRRSKPQERIDTTHLQPAMDRARVCKTPYEIAQIRRANAVSSEAHRQVQRQLRSMRSERDIEAAFVFSCISQGAHQQAYLPIAGAGANASTLHYTANADPLAGRELVCIDAGAEWACYASDVTRTLPVSGRFSLQGAAVYAAVDRMQTACIAAVRPGARYLALNRLATTIAAEELLRLGVLRGGDAAAVVASGTVAGFFPHGLGHHVGLETHDVLSPRLLGAAATVMTRGGQPAWLSPDASAALVAEAEMQERVEGKTRDTLEAGMVVTIEPGIYFCKDYLEAYFLSDPRHSRYIDKEVLASYYKVGGVRIEDCVLVTEDGHENLTTAPKGDEALKIINGECD